jgi:hypothetical protein
MPGSAWSSPAGCEPARRRSPHGRAATGPRSPSTVRRCRASVWPTAVKRICCPRWTPAPASFWPRSRWIRSRTSPLLRAAARRCRGPAGRPCRSAVRRGRTAHPDPPCRADHPPRGTPVATGQGNQPTLHAQLKAVPWAQIPVGDRTRDTGHGRKETRTVKAVTLHTRSGIVAAPETVPRLAPDARQSRNRPRTADWPGRE